MDFMYRLMLRYLDGTDASIPNIFRPFHVHQQPFPVQPHSNIALLESMHWSNSRDDSVVRVLICWPQTVQYVNGQEVISYTVSMHASDAKGFNFNFPTFKSLACALVLHRLSGAQIAWVFLV